MKKILYLFLIVMMSAKICTASAETPQAFAERIANQIMDEVVLSKNSLKQKQDAFRRVFVGATDMNTIARFTLGRYYRSATKEQREEYTKVFTDNVIYTWTERFSNYAGETIKFSGVRQEKNDYYVTSTIDIPNTENDIEIIWRISDKKDELKLVDLVVEGVSMIMSYRNEYTSVLQKSDGDIQILINMLNTKNKDLKNPKK